MTDIFTKLFDAENLAIEGAQVPEWVARPFQLVSLLEMLRFYANFFIELMELLEFIKVKFDSLLPSDPLTTDDLNVIQECLRALLADCS